VADSANQRVQIFDIANPLLPNYVATIGVTGEPGDDNDHFACPTGVDLDDENIYIADSCNNRIQIFDSNGKFLRQWTHLGATQNLFITPSQEMWVITHRNNIENLTYDTLAGRIMKIDLATGRTQELAAVNNQWTGRPQFSPDGKWLLYCGGIFASDIMLIDNFH
jgi:Tol biopolymer transport system component